MQWINTNILKLLSSLKRYRSVRSWKDKANLRSETHILLNHLKLKYHIIVNISKQLLSQKLCGKGLRPLYRKICQKEYLYSSQALCNVISEDIFSVNNLSVKFKYQSMAPFYSTQLVFPSLKTTSQFNSDFTENFLLFSLH